MWKSIAILLLFVTFLVSGLFINLVQAILFLLIATHNRTLYRKVNYYLVWFIYAQLVFLADWWSGSRLRMYGPQDFYDNVQKEHSLTIMNHHYELDWLFTWMATSRFGILGNGRVFLKRVLRFVPVIGWCWNFSDVIYLHRNWDKDQKAIGDGIQQLQEYPSAMALLIYAEGTRYTEEKYKASLEFAKNKGLPLFKHHLVPRVKGFAETLRQLDPTKIKYIYDLTLVVNEKEGAQATLADVLRNRGMVGEVYIRKIPISEVPRENEEDIKNFLMNLYVEKDRLKDNFLTTGHFVPEGETQFQSYEPVELPPSGKVLLNTIVWNLLVAIPVLKLISGIIMSGNVTHMFILSVLMATLYLGLQKMINLTKISKGSEYGSKKQQ